LNSSVKHFIQLSHAYNFADLNLRLSRQQRRRMLSEQGRVVVKARPTFVPAEQEALGDTISILSEVKVGIYIRNTTHIVWKRVKQHSQEYSQGTAAAVHKHHLPATFPERSWLSVNRAF
jgi:hypothetical protein